MFLLIVKIQISETEFLKKTRFFYGDETRFTKYTALFVFFFYLF